MSSPARSAADLYIARVNERDLDGLVALFAPDALLIAAGEATTPAAPGLTARMIDVLSVGADGRIVRLAIYMQLNA